MIRSSLILGAVFMIIGPLIVFTPQRKIVVRKNKLLRAMVRGANKKSTRWISFSVFCLAFAAQLIVLYSLATVTHVVFKLPIVDTVGLVVCYFLISLFYLMAFAVTMLKLEFSVKDHNPLKQIRENVSWLQTEGYLWTYVTIFVLKLLGIVAMACVLLVRDIGAFKDAKDAKAEDPTSQAVSILFFVLTIGGTITFAVFLLIQAFRVEEVVEYVETAEPTGLEAAADLSPEVPESKLLMKREEHMDVAVSIPLARLRQPDQDDSSDSSSASEDESLNSSDASELPHQPQESRKQQEQHFIPKPARNKLAESVNESRFSSVSSAEVLKPTFGRAGSQAVPPAPPAPPPASAPPASAPAPPRASAPSSIASPYGGQMAAMSAPKPPSQDKFSVPARRTSLAAPQWGLSMDQADEEDDDDEWVDKEESVVDLDGVTSPPSKASDSASMIEAPAAPRAAVPAAAKKRRKAKESKSASKQSAQIVANVDDNDIENEELEADESSVALGGLPVQSGGGGGPRTLELEFSVAISGISLQTAMRSEVFESELEQKLLAELQAISPCPLELVSFRVHMGRDSVSIVVQSEGPVAAAMFWAPISVRIDGHVVTLKKL
eukprot:m.163845 g.163845  ORF g.163845 m.163845 type:complete len:607 (-) comp16562_c0_seq2:1121-2941(-)